MHTVVTTLGRDNLLERAETRVASLLSCRSWRNGQAIQVSLGLMLLLSLPVMKAPVATLVALILFTSGLLLVSTVLKVAAVLSSRRIIAVPMTSIDTAALLPVITMIVPLYDEKAIAKHLLARL